MITAIIGFGVLAIAVIAMYYQAAKAFYVIYFED